MKKGLENIYLKTHCFIEMRKIHIKLDVFKLLFGNRKFSNTSRQSEAIIGKYKLNNFEKW